MLNSVSKLSIVIDHGLRTYSAAIGALPSIRVSNPIGWEVVEAGEGWVEAAGASMGLSGVET
jgi:hypothetical protein